MPQHKIGDYCVLGYDGCVQNDNPAAHDETYVCIPRDLLDEMRPMIEMRGMSLEAYVQEKLWAVVQINKFKDPTA